MAMTMTMVILIIVLSTIFCFPKIAAKLFLPRAVRRLRRINRHSIRHCRCPRHLATTMTMTAKVDPLITRQPQQIPRLDLHSHPGNHGLLLLMDGRILSHPEPECHHLRRLMADNALLFQRMRITVHTPPGIAMSIQVVP